MRITFIKISARKGSCMECGHNIVRIRDIDGAEFCNVKCITNWHGLTNHDITHSLSK